MNEIKDVKNVSTKQGDEGYSRNYSNERIKKTDLLFDTLGNLDELSSSLGVVYHHSIKYQLEIKLIQKDLQNIMSLVATKYHSDQYDRLTKITLSDVEKIEELEQSILNVKPLKPYFVLPGSESTKDGSYLDLARAISRRVERSFLRYKQANQRDDLDMSGRYLNRLSDLLYIMARSYDL